MVLQGSRFKLFHSSTRFHKILLGAEIVLDGFLKDLKKFENVYLKLSKKTFPGVTKIQKASTMFLIVQEGCTQFQKTS